MSRPRSRPVRGAYDYARDDIPCPACGAEPFVWCRQASGEVRHAPCVARLLRRPDPERLDGEQPANDEDPE